MDNLRRQIGRLYKAANSDDWWDREVAGFALRDLTEDHFGDVMKLTKEWASDASSRIRRAACLACLQRKRKTSSDRLPIILRRLSVLMKDDDISTYGNVAVRMSSPISPTPTLHSYCRGCVNKRVHPT